MKIKLFLLVLLGPSTPLWAYSEPQNEGSMEIELNSELEMGDTIEIENNSDEMKIEPNASFESDYHENIPELHQDNEKALPPV